MYNTLHFVASSNIKSLLGKDLVTDQIAALFELVKNSYDADAQVVEIILTYKLNGWLLAPIAKKRKIILQYFIDL